MTQRIISGYSDSAGGRDALALGAVLADLEDGTELTVTHAYGDTPPASLWGPPPGWRLACRDRAETVLDPARAAFGTRPSTSFVACRGVSPTDGLHRLADELGASVIVVGASHDHGIGRVRVGGVTEQVLHGAPCAVAVAAAGYADRAGARIGRVAVAFNGSDESRRALAAAARIARDAGARLTVLGAVGEAAVWYGAYAGDDAATVRGVVRDELEVATSELPALRDVRIAVLDGDPAHAIAEATAGEDLLVLGSRGYGPLSRVLLGSVSSHLVRSVACGMLVVPRSAVRSPGDEATTEERAAAAV